MGPDLDQIKRRLRELEQLDENEEDPSESRLTRTLLLLDGEIRYFLREHVGVSRGSLADRQGLGLGLVSALAVTFLLLGIWIAVANPSSDLVELFDGENEWVNRELGEFRDHIQRAVFTPESAVDEANRSIREGVKPSDE